MKTYRDFDVNRSVIANFIHSQNGTISTAIRELVMNGIDKGSNNIEVAIDEEGFEVIDFGTGFESRDYIKKFFGCFGTPHEEGDAKFGIFRIGRGQVMKFGNITWHSNQFKMHTDINSLGMGYLFEEDTNDIFKGCKVTGHFYEKLSSYDVRKAIEELESFVLYLTEEVTINKKQCSSGNRKVAWDHEDEKLKAIWKNNGNGIRIYSQGVYVKTLNAHHYGSLQGDIVSKIPLRLNMARNELSDDDSLWVHISSVIRKKANDEARKKMKARKIDELTRIMLIKQLMYGEISLRDVMKYNLIKNHQEKNISLLTLSNKNMPITLMKKGYEKYADAISFQKTALVIDDKEIDIWESESLEEMLNKIASCAYEAECNIFAKSILSKPIMRIEDLSVGINSSRKIIIDKDLTPRYSAAKDALNKGSKVAAREFSACSENNLNLRKVLIGECVSARAWTDGSSYIALNKDELKILDHGIEGATEMAMILCHEYTHESSNTETNEHDLVFYENFHETLTSNRRMVAGKIANAIYKEYHRSLIKRMEKLPKKATGELPASILMDVYEFEGRSDGEKGLSVISSTLIDFFGAKCKINKGSVNMVFSREKVNAILNRNGPIKALLSLAKKDGFVPKEVDEISSDQKEKFRKEEESVLYCLKEWSTEKGHDFLVIEKIMSARYCYIELIIQLICMDKNSGIIYMSRKSQIIHRQDITKNGIFERYGHDYFTEKRIAPKPEDLAESTTSVEDRTLIEIDKILKNITDEKKRKEISELLLTKDSILRMKRFI